MNTSEYFNMYSNESNHFYYVNMHNLIISLINKYQLISKKTKFLDAGCGTGMLLKKITGTKNKHGIDINPEAIKYSKKRGLNHIVKGSITNIPFSKNTFDLVTSIDVIYHSGVKNDKKAVSEIYRVLKTGGLLIIKVPANKWLLGKHDKVVQTKKRYSKSNLEQILKKARFKLVKISYCNSFLLPLVMVKRLVIEKIFSKMEISDVKKEPKLINDFFIYWGKLENYLLNYLDLPFGLDVIAIAKKI